MNCSNELGSTNTKSIHGIIELNFSLNTFLHNIHEETDYKFLDD